MADGHDAASTAVVAGESKWGISREVRSS